LESNFPILTQSLKPAAAIHGDAGILLTAWEAEIGFFGSRGLDIRFCEGEGKKTQAEETL
jgi:hypothetical protein